MKYLSLICIWVLFSCNENKNATSEIVTKTNTIEFTNEVSLKTDSIELSLDNDLVKNDWVLVQLLEKKYSKDSILNANYRFDFYRNDTLVKQAQIVLKDLFEENGEWYSKTGFTYEETPKHSSYLTISNGYPACGYQHTHFLFYTKNNAFDLVHQYTTFSDSGWGNYVEFIEKNENFIISRTSSFEPDDDGNEDIGIEKLTDSIHFKLEKNKWVKTYITPKDTIYSSRKIAFKTYHNMK